MAMGCRVANRRGTKTTVGVRFEDPSGVVLPGLILAR